MTAKVKKKRKKYWELRLGKFCINCFRPYLSFNRFTTINDIASFHVFLYNIWGVSISVWSWNFGVGWTFYDPAKKWRKEDENDRNIHSDSSSVSGK